MKNRGFHFRPHCWLSDCWFCPDGVPGFAIPFYLAHPRLTRLEKAHMLEIDGHSAESRMKLLRHETAHALANACRLHLKQSWRRRFGRASKSYPESYLPRPYSRNYVLHLDNWYAQSHPAEDWAETFAVWLDPDSRWREKYRDWPAIKKLNYVDQLMNEIVGRSPPVRSKKQVDSIKTLRLTLREYYAEKQTRLQQDLPRFHEQQLRRIFPASVSHKNERAAHFVRKLRREAIANVARWTSESRYRINLTIEDMIRRCEEMNLHASPDKEETKIALVASLVMLYMGSLRSGMSRLAI
ncbi:MAG: putative zinc-binding metallopeptidase [Sulfuricaulis sp.]